MVGKVVFFVVLAVASSVLPDRSEAMQLLSIQGLKLGSDDYVAGFQIKTWGVQIRAICNFPRGWMINAGKEINPIGQIFGSASGFVTNLNSKQLGELKNIALIDDLHSTKGKSATEPSTFEGTISVGSYKTPSASEHDMTLTDSNIVLIPAARCPDPAAN